MIFSIGALFTFLLTLPLAVFAESMDIILKFAWSDTIGWVNFNPTKGNVQVFDDKMVGYIWSENYGWINLNPINGGVKNDGNGNLLGYAWGENIGWIDFSNVRINPNTGYFSGYATILGGPGGTINFDCDNCKVKTNWKKGQTSSLSSGSTLKFPNFTLLVEELFKNFLVKTEYKLMNLLGTKEFKFEIIRNRKKQEENIVKETSFYPIKITFSLNNLPLIHFIFSYFPEEMRILTEKFPQVRDIIEKIGFYNLINRGELKDTKIYIPSISEILSLNLKFGIDSYNNIPSEIIFVRSADEKIDFKPFIILNKDGNFVKKIKLLSGQKVKLIVKPVDLVKSIRGYIVYSSFKESLSEKIFSFALAREIEKKLKIYKFEYEDSNNDRIYVAEINLPKIEGEFEIKTIIEYEKVDLGKKEIRLIASIIPHGYVYEKILGIEARIEGAKVYLYSLNPLSEKFEIWSGYEYNQQNPQITDRSGNYAFIVPAGKYYLEVKKDGYFPFKSAIFELEENSFINLNVELKPKIWWLFRLIYISLFLLILITLYLILRYLINRFNNKKTNE